MKGTLFSADFVKDSNGNLRLLELNTDTGIVGTEIYNIDFTEFIGILENNNISEIDIIYKPHIHNEIINHLSESINQNSQFINSINLHPENINTIYPTQVEDSDSKFILRLAYDESALFDSVYCKGTLDLLNIFTENNEQSHIVSYYYSSSTNFFNTLEFDINPSNLPDVAVKDIVEQFNPINFYKIGYTSDTETNQDRWQSFIDLTKSENKIIQQYHYSTSSLDENNYLTSIRSFQIVYGNDLNHLNLHSYENTAIFNIPQSILNEVDLSQYVSKIADHHYYEYTTNFIKSDGNGILSTHKILMDDSTYQPISDINVGDSITSYFISGSPQVEVSSQILNWEMDGQVFPTGSFITSSEVIYKNQQELKYGGLIEIIVDSESKFVGTNKLFLAYDTSTNKTKFKHYVHLTPGVDYLFDVDGDLIAIDDVNFYTTTDTHLNLIEIDVEEADTYIISGSSAFNGVVSHNAPCFVAGTKISMSDVSYKNVEDVKIGDTVLSYNFNTSKVEQQKVKGIGSKTVDKIVRYTFDDNTILESTLDHPLYSSQIGWVSMDSNYTMEVYGLQTKDAEVGITIFKQDGTNPTITLIEIISEPTIVYNVKTVENNHNFFANNLLVHNRCFTYDTPVKMWDGSIKKIGDIVSGDYVLSYKDGEYVKGKVTNKLIHPTNSIVEVAKYKDMVSDRLHPFYDMGEWKPIYDAQGMDFDIQYIDNFYNLEIDGDVTFESEHNFVVENFIVSGLGDNTILNNTFKRQSIFHTI